MERIVYVVDDDNAVRKSIVRLLQSEGYSAMDFASATAFMSHTFCDAPGCLILDMNMPVADGFDVVGALKQSGRVLPIIFLTGYGTIPLSVRAMKAGAHEFLTKPVASDVLLQAVEGALQLAKRNSSHCLESHQLQQRFLSLTRREQEVLWLTIRGLLNKQMAAELGVSEITVKVHRRRVMEKMQVRSLADLVRAAERLQPTETA
ncbi:response regulator transcription factor [Duffyella gerundensis]|uniref:response regulator transcription factor n=1 Tax=Duffyella gerundensis TaxID=1619313 RepID=UPI003FD03794